MESDLSGNTTLTLNNKIMKVINGYPFLLSLHLSVYHGFFQCFYYRSSLSGPSSPRASTIPPRPLAPLPPGASDAFAPSSASAAASCRCAAGRCQGPARRSPGASGQAPDHWPAAGPLRRAVDRPDHGATAAATREPLPKIEAHTQLTLLLKGFYMH